MHNSRNLCTAGTSIGIVVWTNAILIINNGLRIENGSRIYEATKELSKINRFIQRSYTAVQKIHSE